ncbi:BLUF domain-containing protein [Fulvivirga sp. RKSG066]|uniref:BLUF domain-containing protein n=1 Tax=Fulvivirga aurantia TaxID=2529383 RepID=UPI0012BBC42C|nr:BLUF domain-containing protein [Fulvivirga aurantia]MTI22823.1 BLUF domain-containing protein [Fulvivirga aurantia]
MDLHHIIYVSKAVHITTADLDDIVNAAHNFNTKNNITGMLLYIDGKFFQVIEGNKEDINNLYAKIRTDPRHKNITTVSAHPIKFRTFKGWNMRYKAITEKEFSELSGINVFTSLFSLKPGPKENVAFNFARKFSRKSFPSPTWWDDRMSA